MEIVLSILAPVAIILGFIPLLAVYSKSRTKKWLSKPSDEGGFLDNNGIRLFHRIRGRNDPVVVFLNEPGSSSAEWWPIQNDISLHCRSICFERPGYAWSKVSEDKNLSFSVSEQLEALLKFERIRKPVLLVSNGAATIFARYFAQRHPESVAGLLLINPHPINASRWMASLAELEEYTFPSDIAQKRKKRAAKGYYRLFPFLPGYKLDKRYRKLLAEHYSAPTTYDTQIKELSMLRITMEALSGKPFPPQLPVRILFSGDESMIRESIKRGVPEYTARQVVRLYREMTLDLATMVPKRCIQEYERCGEYLHLGIPKVIAEIITEFVREIYH